MLNRQSHAALVAVVGIGLAAPAFVAVPAFAEPFGCRDTVVGRVCTVTAEQPGTGAATDRGTANTGSSSSTKRTCLFRGDPIDCDPPDAGLWWSNDRQCWVGVADPQPPKDDPVWQGHTEGIIYQCRRAGSGLGSGTWMFWSDTPPPSTPRTNPAQLAQRAIERMELQAPVIAMTPLDPAAPLLVGMDAWMWLAEDGPASVGPITRTATAGGTTVTATAEVTKVVWDLGDGTRVTCAGAGTPWTPRMGTGPSPTCGHRFMRPSTGEPGGTFQVRATAYWAVDWSGAGQTGRISFTLSGERDLAVTELQVLQTS